MSENNACEIQVAPPNNMLFELRNITPKLYEIFRFTNIVNPVLHDHNYKEIKTEGDGQASYRTIFWTEKIAACDNMMAAGTTWPHHQHKGHETFIVYEGALSLHYNDIVVNILAGHDAYRFKSTYQHWAFAEVNTRFLAITMPGDKDWLPNGSR